jgi:hypothetical protein
MQQEMLSGTKITKMSQTAEKRSDGAQAADAARADGIASKTTTISQVDGGTGADLKERLLRNVLIETLTGSIRGQLDQAATSEIQVALLLDEGYAAVDRESFRVWVRDILNVDEKWAYALRSIGKRFRTHVEEERITNEAMSSLGVSRLLTVARFPEDDLRVTDTRGVEVLVSDTWTDIATLSVAELRETLAAAKKRAKADGFAELNAKLSGIRKECGSEAKCLSAVQADKDITLNQLKQWKKKVEGLAEAKNGALARLESKLQKLQEAKVRLAEEKESADWWLDLLKGHGETNPSGTKKSATKAAKVKAAPQRRAATPRAA